MWSTYRSSKCQSALLFASLQGGPTPELSPASVKYGYHSTAFYEDYISLHIYIYVYIFNTYKQVYVSSLYFIIYIMYIFFTYEHDISLYEHDINTQHSTDYKVMTIQVPVVCCFRPTPSPTWWRPKSTRPPNLRRWSPSATSRLVWRWEISDFLGIFRRKVGDDFRILSNRE